MKKLLTFAALIVVLHACAQNMPTPEYKDKVMFVDANNKLAELEKTDMSTNLHTNMGGHSEVNIIANGKAAALQHSGSPADNYIVKIEPGVDPANVVELFKFDEGKKNRKILVAEMSMGKDKAVELTKAKIVFKKISDGVYEINTTAQLESGEYCFTVSRPNISIMGAVNSQSLIGYCFNVQ